MRAVTCFIAVMLCLSACGTIDVSPPVRPGSRFTGYGESRGSAFTVRVVGNVLHAGDYHLPEGSTLYDLLMRVGESRTGVPRLVTLKVETADGGIAQTVIVLTERSPDELRSIRLGPGLTCSFS